MDDTYPLFPSAATPVNAHYQRQQVDRALKTVESGAAEPDDRQLKAACQEMESLFVNHLFKELRATVDKSGFISGGRAEEIFTSMLDVELSRKISATRGIGLSEILFEQLRDKSVKRRGSDPE
jgi:flagellar protein FlgJ